MTATSKPWLQLRGDPVLRAQVFEQERVPGEFDRRLDEVLACTVRLLQRHGVFHAKIHFSAGRIALWFLTDPLRYRVFSHEQFLAPAFCDVFRRLPYTPWAVVPYRSITRVLDEFGRLRTMDPHLYLRAGSLNVVNGLVGLNFSCDGSHYVDYAEFLANPGRFSADGTVDMMSTGCGS